MGWGRYAPVNNPEAAFTGQGRPDSHSPATAADPVPNENGSNGNIEITDWSQYDSAAASVLQRKGQFAMEEFRDEEDGDQHLSILTSDDDENDISTDDGPHRRPHQQAALRPPSNYLCPLTLQLMEIPMTDSCGHTFDCDAISAWLELNEFCPISRKPMTMSNLVVNKALKKRIRLWSRQHPQFVYGVQEGFYVRGMRRSSRVVHHATDDDDNYGENNYYDTGDDHGYQETVSQMELILLPQERKMLGAIKNRAQDLRKSRQRQNCVYAMAGVVAGILIIAFTFALKNLSDRFSTDEG